MEKLVNFADVDSSFKIKEPGFCVKARVKGTVKFFINFCHSTTVSPPTLILSEEELQGFIETENYDELSNFSIPLIIEKLETTRDKKGSASQVTHVIVNSKFYREYISSSDIYKSFLIYVTIESINAKFSIKIDHSSHVILQNKHFQLADNQKAFNKFIDCYVEGSKVKQVEDEDTENKLKAGEEALGEAADPNSNVRISLDCNNELVEMAIKLDKEIAFDDLVLLLNDDRVVIKHKDQVLNDFHISVMMKAEQACASFKRNVLQIKCPVCL